MITLRGTEREGRSSRPFCHAPRLYSGLDAVSGKRLPEQFVPCDPSRAGINLTGRNAAGHSEGRV